MLLVIFYKLLLAVFTFPVTATATHDDLYIVCANPVPGPELGPWPLGYDRSDYYDNIDLCSQAQGKVEQGDDIYSQDPEPRNVGCRCVQPNTRPLCLSQYADQTLFWWSGLYAGLTFPALCALYNCFCTTELIRDGYLQNNALGAAVFVYDFSGNPYLPTGVLPYGVQPVTLSITDIPGLNSTTEHVNNVTSGYHQLTEAPSEALCGNSCTTKADCTGPGGSYCSCQVQNTTVVPGVGATVGTIVHAAICTWFSASLGTGRGRGGGGGGGKKRDVDVLHESDPPCPCNSTYVSHQCCVVDDGLVWEHPSAKLGELVKQDQKDMAKDLVWEAWNAKNWSQVV